MYKVKCDKMSLWGRRKRRSGNTRRVYEPNETILWL